MPRDYLRAGVLVAVVVSAAVFAGTTVAASEPSISAADDSPDATTEHTTTVVVDGNAAGGSWNGFQIDYEATDVSNVGTDDIQTIGIDNGNDASGTTIDEDVSNDLSSAGADNDGQTLDIGLDGSSNIQSGDELVVVFADAQNPGSSGDYSVTLHVNQGSADETATTTLSIGSTTTTTATPDPTTTSEPTATQTIESTTTEPATTEATQSTTESDNHETTRETPTQTTHASTTTQTTSNDGGNGGGNWGGSSDAVSATQASIAVDPAEPNATATHVVSATVQTVGSDLWNTLKINYNGTGTDVSNVDQNDIKKIGIDRSNDDLNTTIDASVANDLSEVSGSNDGTTLTIGLDGLFFLHAGDEVVVVYEDVQNPPTGQYSIPVDINHQSSGTPATASMALQQSSTTDPATTAPTETPTETTESPITTDADSSTATPQSTSVESPGFSTIAAVVALAAAAALLVRR